MNAPLHQPLGASARAPQLDARVLAEACAGDARACRAVVERFQRPVFALLSRMLGPAGRQDLVEDLAQECFLRVFRSLPRFQLGGPAALSTWILTIASRLAIDELRRRAPAGSPVLAEAQAAPGPTPEQATEQRERLARVSACVDGLAPEYRAALVLRLYHELSYEEIAAALGVELGTVKSRLARARTALEAALHEVNDASR